jgi:hypothetical protein
MLSQWIVARPNAAVGTVGSCLSELERGDQHTFVVFMQPPGGLRSRAHLMLSPVVVHFPAGFSSFHSHTPTPLISCFVLSRNYQCIPVS